MIGKREVLRRFQKTVSVGSEVASGDRLAEAASSHRKRTITNSGQPCMSDRGD